MPFVEGKFRVEGQKWEYHQVNACSRDSNRTFVFNDSEREQRRHSIGEVGDFALFLWRFCLFVCENLQLVECNLVVTLGDL